jgi:hypothetical protein
MWKTIFIAVIGIAFLVASTLTALNTREFVRSSIVVPGHVVALNAGGSHPEIAFVTRTGQRISYPEGGFILGMKVGDLVQVRYDENAPLASATLDKVGTVWFAPIFLGIMSIGFLLTALSNLSSLKKLMGR